MDATPSEHRVHRPGGVSSFFVYKAGFMATACWIWFAVLVIRDESVSRWLIVAATGAITTTLIGVILGARHALARGSAARHEQVMHTLVELSWQAFTPMALPAPTAGPAATSIPTDSDADIIRLPHEPRPRRR
jgi:hypothetical protein